MDSGILGTLGTEQVCIYPLTLSHEVSPSVYRVGDEDKRQSRRAERDNSEHQSSSPSVKQNTAEGWG